MFKNKTIRAFLALAPLALFIEVNVALAADFPQRLAHEATSRTTGFDRSRLPLLERVPGPGKEAVAGTLLARFAAGSSISTAGTTRQDASESRLAVTSDAGWALKVWADGTRVSYRNFPLLDSPTSLDVPVAERFTESKLETLGRAFIGENLGGLVTLGAGETLVPLFTEFALRGGMAADGSATEPDKVAASTVIFTRAVGGVPMVGPGSKVAVTFTNDGKAVAFDLDWPRYRTRTEQQSLLPAADIRARSKVLAEFAGFPEETVTEHFECGYYDAGARRKDPGALIQAGCFLQAYQRRIVDPEIHALSPRSGHVLVAKGEAIPAGLQVVADGGWPEAMALLGLPSEAGGTPGGNPPAR